MTVNEQIVFRELAQYLDRFNDPPARGDSNEAAWWEKASDTLSDAAARCYNHPLMIEMGIAIYTYIEIKAKAKGEARNENVHG